VDHVEVAFERRRSMPGRSTETTADIDDIDRDRSIDDRGANRSIAFRIGPARAHGLAADMETDAERVRGWRAAKSRARVSPGSAPNLEARLSLLWSDETRRRTHRLRFRSLAGCPHDLL
jgi:hypothetical protein